MTVCSHPEDGLRCRMTVCSRPEDGLRCRMTVCSHPEDGLRCRMTVCSHPEDGLRCRMTVCSHPEDGLRCRMTVCSHPEDGLRCRMTVCSHPEDGLRCRLGVNPHSKLKLISFAFRQSQSLSQRQLVRRSTYECAPYHCLVICAPWRQGTLNSAPFSQPEARVAGPSLNQSRIKSFLDGCLTIQTYRSG